MKKLLVICLVTAVTGFMSLAGGPAPANAAATLDELLEEVRTGRAEQNHLNAQRESEFLASKSRQASILKKAKAELVAEERRSDRLEKTFENNEIRIAGLEKLLTDRLGNLGELFGIVRQVAGDTRGNIDNSIISGQLPGRSEHLGKLAQSKELPTIPQLESLWYTLQQEMTESGKNVRFNATVITADGKEVEMEVVRIGAFNAIADGKYLNYLPEAGKYAELNRQPAGRYLSMVEDYEEAREGLLPLAVDPARGGILALLVQTPSLTERIAQGKEVGYIIIGLGFIGLLIVFERMFHLYRVSSQVKAQMKSNRADLGNPLGRVLAVYDQHKSATVETLELKLDEAILKETPQLERGLSTVKVLGQVAPLLGLLGTVTGMIETFQQITLFGTGDPKTMAGGISQALVTTVLGLCAAIPLVLLHSVVAARSKSVVHILEEQSAGIIAMQAEKGGQG